MAMAIMQCSATELSHSSHIRDSYFSSVSLFFSGCSNTDTTMLLCTLRFALLAKRRRKRAATAVSLSTKASLGLQRSP